MFLPLQLVFHDCFLLDNHMIARFTLTIFFFNLLSICVYLSLFYPNTLTGLWNKQQSFLQIVQHRFAFSSLATVLSCSPMIWTGYSGPGIQVPSCEFFLPLSCFIPALFSGSHLFLTFLSWLAKAHRPVAFWECNRWLAGLQMSIFLPSSDWQHNHFFTGHNFPSQFEICIFLSSVIQCCYWEIWLHSDSLPLYMTYCSLFLCSGTF